MKRNTVVIETDNGERFEVKFNPWRKVILVTCLKTNRRLDFISPIKNFMGFLKIPLIEVEEGIYSDVLYKCRTKEEFQIIMSALKTLDD